MVVEVPTTWIGQICQHFQGQGHSPRMRQAVLGGQTHDLRVTNGLNKPTSQGVIPTQGLLHLLGIAGQGHLGFLGHFDIGMQRNLDAVERLGRHVAQKTKLGALVDILAL